MPNDPELPLPLDKVHPLHEVVQVDYFLPGLPAVGRRDLDVPDRPRRRTHAAAARRTASSTTTDADAAVP